MSTRTHAERAENIMKARAFNPPTREEKHAEGVERNTIWQAKTPAEKLAALDQLFGAGKGAKRQRAKLATKITRAGLDHNPTGV